MKTLINIPIALTFLMIFLSPVDGKGSGEPNDQHFILRVGEGYDFLEVAGLADDLRAKGCSVMITSEQAIPSFMTVENGKNGYDFYKDEFADANQIAVKWCVKAKNKEK